MAARTANAGAVGAAGLLFSLCVILCLLHADERTKAEESLAPELRARSAELQQYKSLAQQSLKAGKVPEAIATQGEIVTLVRKSVGPTHDALAETLQDLAAMEELRAGFAAARAAREEALAILTRLHGQSHWKVAGARWALDDVARLEKMSPRERESLGETDRLSVEASEQEKQGKRSDALFTLFQVVGIRHQLLGDKHPRFADSLSQAAEIYLTLGEATKAGALYGKASGIYREAFGITHPRYTETQARLAKLRQAASASAKMRSPPDQPASGGQGLDKGDLRPGLATPRSASTSASKDGKLTLWQAAQLMTVTPRLSQIIPLMNRGEFEEAARLAVEVEAVTRNVFEPTHPMYVRTLEMLAKTQEASGDVAAARKSWQKYLSLSTGLYGPQHWKVNEARWTLRELERRSRLATAPGDARQLREARHLHGTAIQLVSQGRYNAALETATKALAILDKTETRSDPIYLGTLADLAVILARLGETQRAVALGRKAVALAQQHLGREHPITARALGNLGGMLVDAGEYVEGESLCREFVEIIKKTYGPDHPQYAVGLSRLGDLHESMGDYPRAEPFFREAVNVAKANLTDDPLGYANRLANLAGLYVNMREYTRAEPLYLEAKAIIGKSLGEGHHEYAVALNRLAHLHVMTGSPEQAVPLLLRALEILRKTAGEEHASYRRSVRQLACAFAEMGKYDQAEELFQRVLKGTKSASGHHLAGYVSALNDLGGLYLAAGKYREAERCFREILEYARRDLERASLIQSERQQYAMLASQRASLDVYLSVASQAGVAVGEIYEFVLPWKGAILGRQRRLRQASNDPQYAKLLAELEGITSRLAAIALVSPAKESRDAWRREVTELTDRKERLETELSRLGPALQPEGRRDAITAEKVMPRLPAEAALLDCLEVMRFEPPPQRRGKLQAARHFVVFVVRSGQPVVEVDLGPSAPIERAVEAWRQDNLPRESSRAIGTEAHELKTPAAARPGPEATLRQLVWEPLEKHLNKARVIFISPDGALARFPWAALPGRTPDSYLIEEYAMAIIPVPQTLPELLAEPPEAGQNRKEDEASWLLMGDVDFGAAPDAVNLASVGTRGTESELARRPDRDRHPTAADRGSTPWPLLPGTSEEINRLEQLWHTTHPGSPGQTLRGSQATEDSFRRLAPRFRYLHLATHGYFAPAPMQSALDYSMRAEESLPGIGLLTERFAREGLTGWHPGLLSGLVLAGANRRRLTSATETPIRDDGILTALEVSTLDLRGVDLVVLSACETGLGRQAGGEGLLGLQRAFQAAGARSVVASLWKVDDQTTRRLMTHFYENLWQKHLGKMEALRQAQLAILRERFGPGTSPDRGPVQAEDVLHARTAPRLWAAWAISGDPGDLRCVAQSGPTTAAADLASLSEGSEGRQPASDASSGRLWWLGTLCLVAVAAAGLTFWHMRRRRNA